LILVGHSPYPQRGVTTGRDGRAEGSGQGEGGAARVSDPLNFRLGMQADVSDDLIEQVVNSVGTWRPAQFHK
jgi:hypothetical protein